MEEPNAGLEVNIWYYLHVYWIKLITFRLKTLLIKDVEVSDVYLTGNGLPHNSVLLLVKCVARFKIYALFCDGKNFKLKKKFFIVFY